MRSAAWACLLVISWSSAAVWAQAPVDPPPAPLELLKGDWQNTWHFHAETANQKLADAWKMDGTVLHCLGVGKSYLRTKTAYADYNLKLEWRWPGPTGNSGVMLHIVNEDKFWPKGIEAQLHAGHAGDFFLFSDARSPEEVLYRNPNGVSTGRLERKDPSLEKPEGEWNLYEIVAEGSTLTVSVNGKSANKLTNVVPSGGMIALQAEGAAIDFRNIVLTPLTPRKNLHAPPPAQR